MHQKKIIDYTRISTLKDMADTVPTKIYLKHSDNFFEIEVGNPEKQYIDDKGQVITRMFIKNENHILYETNDSGDIGMMFKMLNPDNTPKEYKWEIISVVAAEISSLLINKSLKKRFIRNLARAYNDFFYADYDSAVATFNKLEMDVSTYRLSKGKIYYLTSCLVFSSLVMLLAPYVYPYFKQVLKSSGSIFDTAELSILLYAAAFGSLGGTLSVSYSLKNLKLDLAVNDTLNGLSGIMRIFIAMISSVIIILALEAEIIGFLKGTNFSLKMTLAVAAGFSESFIPNILANIEQQVKDNIAKTGAIAKTEERLAESKKGETSNITTKTETTEAPADTKTAEGSK